MRNLDFEKALIELDQLISKGQIEIKEMSEEVQVLSMLAIKCRLHCNTARELMASESLAEAVIVLRAAYEATILGLYLQQNTDKIKRYITYSALTTLRCQQELLQILQRNGDKNPDEKKQQKYIAQQKQSIIASGNLSEFKLSAEDLDDWERIKKYTSSAHFIKFQEMRSNIKTDSNTRALIETGYQIYNLGSQTAHANFDMVELMLTQKISHPLFGEHAMYRQILDLLNASLIILSFCKMLSDDEANAIKQFCHAASIQLADARSKELPAIK